MTDDNLIIEPGEPSRSVDFADRPAARLALLMLDRGRELGCEHRPGVPAPLSVSELARLVWHGAHARKRHLLVGWLEGRQTRTQTVIDVAAYFGVDPGVFTDPIEPA